MFYFLKLILPSILLCLYLQTVFYLLIDLLCLSVPWLLWGTIVLLLLIRFSARVPPPDDSVVKKVLGMDPLVLDQEEEREIDRQTENVEEEAAQYCIRVVAHRGAGFDYPENSMSAFRHSHQKGCDAIEFDLALTKDNVPIIFHDDTIDRLTGTFGTIKDMTWNELKDYDISTNHPLRVKLDTNGEKIALFEEVVEEALTNETRMFIDIKATGKEVIKVVLDAFKKYPLLYERAVISSFNPITIYMIRRKDPRIIAGIAWRPQFFSMGFYSGIKGPRESRFSNLFLHILAMIVDAIHDWAYDRITYYVLGLSFILLHKDIISPEVIRLWNDRGIRVFAWSVNLPSEKKHFMKNLKVSYLTDTLMS
ncbi:glycerophosphodiester phosphodiesterase 1 [Copidosoma floridanum]|uniref:glycerophosphodiester phosphodiesterase 1 n=1 Tax=Copidosoma floridanum TaxID=29053 RepID=UPI0006C983BC|nr:glycerophosphodiester phosphodiesterase 1 [Copidosoma floridanum]